MFVVVSHVCSVQPRIPCLPLELSALSFIEQCFQTGHSEFFYTNDIYVLLDVLMRRTWDDYTDEQVKEYTTSVSLCRELCCRVVLIKLRRAALLLFIQLCLEYLLCLSGLLSWPNYSSSRYKQSDLTELLQHLQQHYSPDKQADEETIENETAELRAAVFELATELEQKLQSL